MADPNLLLLCYADDALNLIYTIQQNSDIFASLHSVYAEFGLESSVVVVFFNWKEKTPEGIFLMNTRPHLLIITYFCLSIASLITHDG